MTGHHRPGADGTGRRPGASCPASARSAARRDPGRQRSTRGRRRGAFALFRAALGPLAAAGKLGYVLFQFAPWVHFERALARIPGAALPARLPGLDAGRRVAPPLLVSRSRRRDAARPARGRARPRGDRRARRRPGAMPHVVAVTAPTAVMPPARPERRRLAAPAPRRGAGGAREVRLSLLRSRSCAALVPELGRGGRGRARSVRLVQQQQPRLSGPATRSMLQRLLGQPTRGTQVFISYRPVRLSIVAAWLTAAPPIPASSSRNAPTPLLKLERLSAGARRRAVGQARRPDRPARVRQQDPQARVPGRRRPRPGRRHPHHLRHAPVELLPGGVGGRRPARPARGARPQGRAARRVRRQPPARPACSAPASATAATQSGSEGRRGAWRPGGRARARPRSQALRDPESGATAVGALGYLACGQEIAQQIRHGAPTSTRS